MYRFEEELTYKNRLRGDNIDTYWDDDYDLDDKPGWEARYEFEKALLSTIIFDDIKMRKILELGSGPGHLGDKILERFPSMIYDRVDGPSAFRAYQRRGYKGRNFIVKDMFDTFDYEGLDESYDLVIANDFLEHIRNPALIVSSVRKLLKPTSTVFISIPNWRMKHDFYYPGLFDFDNFVKFLRQEHFDGIKLWESWGYHCPIEAPRQPFETGLPDEFIQSWNWYISCKLSEDYIKEHNL